MSITALCVQRNSIYQKLGVNSYDIRRNAREYTGTDPVICHPPCRGYSAFTKHWAKPRPGEKDLAYFCMETMCRNGGILEHPAHSRFITGVLGLRPGNKITTKITDIKCIEIHQSWFGYETTKKTWLLMPDYYEIPEIPFELLQYGKEKQIFENMSKNQRSATTEAFARWLIKTIKNNN